METAVVFLIIAYAMPGKLPDITSRTEVPSLTYCEQEAHRFNTHVMPDLLRDKGAVGMYAGCWVPKDYTLDD